MTRLRPLPGQGYGAGCALLALALCCLAACQILGPQELEGVSTPQPTPALTPTVTNSEIALSQMGVPPGPVLTIAPLPDGEFLAGVGPVGDVDSGLEWQLYRGRDDVWQRLFWPSEAIPRALHLVPDLLPDDEMPFTDRVLFAVPFSNALFGRGQAWGLMRSANSGRSWQQALDGLGDPYVMDLALSPATSPNHTMFVVTWYSGVYGSTDAGRTWEAMPLVEEELKPSGGPNPYDLAVAVSPSYQDSAGEGLVMASFSHGLYRWDPTTEAWQTIPITVTATVEDFDPPEAQLTAGEIAFSPDFADDGTIYLQSGYAGLFRSTDRGETWQNVSRRLPLRPPFVADFHLAAASADEAYVLLDSEKTDTVLGQPVRVLFRTRDGGRVWEALQDPPTLGWVSTFILTRDAEGRTILHLGGSRGGVSSHQADDLIWD